METSIKVSESITLFLMQKKWVISGKNGFYPLDGKNIHFILPLLEQEYTEFKKKYDDYMIEANTETQFPLIELLKFPLENKLEYWSNLSLKWLNAIENYDSLIDWFTHTETNWMSQKLKHDFFRIRNRYTRPR